MKYITKSDLYYAIGYVHGKRDIHGTYVVIKFKKHLKKVFEYRPGGIIYAEEMERILNFDHTPRSGSRKDHPHARVIRFIKAEVRKRYNRPFKMPSRKSMLRYQLTDGTISKSYIRADGRLMVSDIAGSHQYKIIPVAVTTNHDGSDFRLRFDKLSDALIHCSKMKY